MKAFRTSSILAKAMFIVGGITLVFIVFLISISDLYVQGTLRFVDNSSLNEKAKRLKEIFASELHSQNALVKNWGVWDDLYDYAQKPNEKFEKANLGVANLDDLSSHFVLIFNKQNSLIGYAQKNSEQNDTKIVFQKNSSCLSSASLQKVSRTITDSVCVEQIMGKDIVFAMHPIVPSDKKGEPDGVIVFARWMNGEFYSNVSKLFGAKVQKVELLALPNKLTGGKLSQANDSSWIDVSNETKEGYIYFGDTTKPFALKYEFSRELYSYGLDMLKKFALIGIVIIAVGSFMMFWFLKTHILSRLIELSSTMNSIGHQDEVLYLKSHEKISDEIEETIAATNMMLNRMYLYQEELSKRGEELEAEVKVKIDELREKDMAMIRQSRYASIGETIANISHQWRQPLNDLWLLLQSVSVKYKAGKLDEDKFSASMGEARKLIGYMSDTIGDFQSFFKADKEKVAFFVNDTVQKAIGIAGSSLINNDIKISFKEDGKFMVFGVPNEFAQAVLNIINNARDAFAGKDIADKRIDVSIENIAGIVIIGIEDSAGGIGEEMLSRVFEPYFSTKYSTGGTGLGLYIARQVVEQCEGGSIVVTNGEHGASFQIMLQEKNN